MNRVLPWRKAIQRSSLSATTRHVLLNLSVYMNDEGFCFPSVRQQAKDTGLSPRSICTHLEAAAQALFIERQARALPGRKWKAHSYRALLPAGPVEGASTTPASIADNAVEPHSTGRTEVVERPDGEVLKEVQSNSSMNSSKSDYLWNGQIIKLTERDFRAWQQSAGVSEGVLADYLEKRDSWLETRPETERVRWFLSTSNDLKRQFQKSDT